MAGRPLLEGSDQHRGWFQSSLLEACGTRGRAPYDAVMTHGFTLDEKGGEDVEVARQQLEPQEVISQSGRRDPAPVGRRSPTIRGRQRIGPTILQTTDRRLSQAAQHPALPAGRAGGFDAAERVTLADMPPLERFILHRLAELDGQVRAAYADYDFRKIVRALLDFCSNDLSALYFDIRRDALYCDAHERAAPRRAHGDGRGVRAPDRLARADPRLHHGGGLARAA